MYGLDIRTLEKLDVITGFELDPISGSSPAVVSKNRAFLSNQVRIAALLYVSYGHERVAAERTLAARSKVSEGGRRGKLQADRNEAHERFGRHVEMMFFLWEDDDGNDSSCAQPETHESSRWPSQCDPLQEGQRLVAPSIRIASDYFSTIKIIISTEHRLAWLEF